MRGRHAATCGVLGLLFLAACKEVSQVDDGYYRLQMETDLVNLLHAEDAYFAGFATYSVSEQDLHFAPSYGVTVLIQSASGSGWSATAKHISTASTCAVYDGSASAPISGATKRQPLCQ